MRPNMQVAFDHITDTFGGADGGVSFANLMFLVRDLDSRAEKGDTSAAEALEQSIMRMHRLILIANMK